MREKRSYSWPLRGSSFDTDSPWQKRKRYYRASSTNGNGNGNGEPRDIQEEMRVLKHEFGRIQKEQGTILHRLHRKIYARISPDTFAWDDLAQQIVGAMIISAPMAVTGEVWDLARNLDVFRAVAMVGITLLFNILLIYYTKYQNTEEEKLLGFIPTRLVSQVSVSYIAAAGMLYLFGVIGGTVQDVETSLRLVVFVGLFANIGAGAADLLK